MAVFASDAPLRSADAIAHTDCIPLTLDRPSIVSLRQNAPEKSAGLTAALCRLAARRIADTPEHLGRKRMMTRMF
jgi:hypothetical protein